MQIYNMARQTGKTTRCIQFMRENPGAILIIPNIYMRSLYPKDLRDRVFTARDFLEYSKLAGKRLTEERKAILDEGVMYRKFDIAQLYYELGRRGWSVVTYGTDEATHPYYRSFEQERFHHNREQFKREYLGQWAEEETPLARDIRILNWLASAEHLSTEEKIEIARREGVEEEYARFQAKQPGASGATTSDAQEDAGRINESSWLDGGRVRRPRHGIGDTARPEQEGNEEPPQGERVREEDSK